MALLEVRSRSKSGSGPRSLREATDREVFLAAREASAVVMTKDSDFVSLLEQLGSPPRILWVTVGNTSNAHLKEVLTGSFDAASGLVHRGEPLVEKADKDRL